MTPGTFLLIFTREASFVTSCFSHCDFLFFSAHQGLFAKIYSKSKEFAPKGSKFFSFGVDLFSGGGWVIWNLLHIILA